MTLNIGVIGCGMIGQDHIRRITDVLAGARVAGVTDPDRDRATKAAEKPGAQVFDDADSLIASGDIDAIMVCSWGPAHEEAILPALAAGKPVFCEKPLAPTRDACQRIVDAEVRLGRRLIQVGFMRRYDRGYRAMKNALEAGDIGAPLIFHSKHRNAEVPADLYTSEMAISDTMVHDFDVTRWLMGGEIERIRVFHGRKNSKGGDLRDPILSVMELSGGGLATCEVSVNIGYGYDIGAEVSGENGVINIAETNAALVKNGSAFHGRVPADWRERFITAYDIEIDEWIKAASQGGATGPSAWDGYAITAVSDAGLEAARSGGAVEIRLGEKPGLYD